MTEIKAIWTVIEGHWVKLSIAAGAGFVLALTVTTTF